MGRPQASGVNLSLVARVVRPCAAGSVLCAAECGARLTTADRADRVRSGDTAALTGRLTPRAYASFHAPVLGADRAHRTTIGASTGGIRAVPSARADAPAPLTGRLPV